MTVRATASALAVVALCAPALSGCLTPHIRPPPSKAVVQSRARVIEKAESCRPGGLETISPLTAGFGFDETKVSEMAEKNLKAAAHWLACNPGVEVVVIPGADGHGDAAHMNDLAQQRGKAVVEELRALGATAPVIHLLPRNGADPVTAPHLVINAQGRGW